MASKPKASTQKVNAKAVQKKTTTPALPPGKKVQKEEKEEEENDSPKIAAVVDYSDGRLSAVINSRLPENVKEVLVKLIKNFPGEVPDSIVPTPETRATQAAAPLPSKTGLLALHLERLSSLLNRLVTVSNTLDTVMERSVGTKAEALSSVSAKAEIPSIYVMEMYLDELSKVVNKLEQRIVSDLPDYL